MSDWILNGQFLKLSDIAVILNEDRNVVLGDDARERVQACRRFLDDKIERHPDPIYGINTGFGSLCDTQISKDSLFELQEKLVMSHACGTGRYTSEEVVELMLLLKAHGLSLAYSGVHDRTVDRLLQHFNTGLLPVIYDQGSLGASGDLAPLAHLALPLIGRGEVWTQEGVSKASGALAQLGWEPLQLDSKEGLALLNGTQFMSAHGTLAVLKAWNLLDTALEVAALSLEAYDGRPEPFENILHTLRPHPGQAWVAMRMRDLLEGSELIGREKKHVQDPYSFRCIPQVIGTVYDTIVYAEQVVEREINSVTDNPTVVPEEDKVISGGNFHGQPIAMVLDYLAIAIAELGSISERRTYKLLHGHRGLPAFLTPSPGLNSGFMIPQYTAASIVSKNKQLCTPSTVDTIDSSNGQEDHVSMGANAGAKLLEVLDNVETLLGIELMCAAQALEFRRPSNSSPVVEKLVSDYREFVAPMKEDRELYTDIQASKEFISVNASRGELS